MKFMVKFKTVDKFAINLKCQEIGFDYIAKLVKTFKKVPINLIYPKINSMETNPSIVVPDEYIINARIFKKHNNVVVAVPEKSLNHIVDIDPFFYPNNDKYKYMCQYQINKLKFINEVKKWIKIGTPLLYDLKNNN